jgi:hypothetical protein
MEIRTQFVAALAFLRLPNNKKVYIAVIFSYYKVGSRVSQ